MSHSQRNCCFTAFIASSITPTAIPFAVAHTHQFGPRTSTPYCTRPAAHSSSTYTLHLALSQALSIPSPHLELPSILEN
ncbi:hypothetical protein BDQ12DRAFT_4499 [Crucibulum laeve]|uniref:Uncharacterized protein n=1 Tax=Crucibulum laeve TaxID=68775 RepID=A0A5C3MIF7_9AGAR|nr:hypothetical protein BDQ12DRAFT_4499 [Crucibulum laeve]